MSNLSTLNKTTTSPNNPHPTFSIESKQLFIKHACTAISRHNPSTPLSPTTTLSKRKITSSEENITPYIIDLKDLSTDPDPIVKRFLIHCLGETLSSATLCQETLNTLFSLYKKLLIGLLCQHPPSSLKVSTALHCFDMVALYSTFPNNQKITQQSINLVDLIYEQFNNRSKYDLLQSYLDYFTSAKSETVSMLYLQLILKSHDSVVQKLLKDIIDSIKEFPSLTLGTLIKKDLDSKFEGCTSGGLTLLNQQKTYYNKLSAIKDEPRNRRLGKLDWLLNSIISRSNDTVINILITSNRFQSLLLLPRTPNSARTIALNIIELIAKIGDQSNKTAIHSLIIKHFSNFIPKEKFESLFDTFSDNDEIKTDHDIINIINTRKALYEYSNYFQSFTTTFNILGILFEDRSVRKELESFTVLKLLGVNPELKKLFKNNFNS